jgi:hypothetical protein
LETPIRVKNSKHGKAYALDNASSAAIAIVFPSDGTSLSWFETAFGLKR